MSVKYPYFKFFSGEWLNGNIAFESDNIKGIFTDACALYWHRDGVMTLEELSRKISMKKLEPLLGKYIIKNPDGSVSIAFLDEQYEEMEFLSKQNSRNGKLGGRPKKTDPLSGAVSEDDTGQKAIREENRIEENKKEENIEISDKKISSEISGGKTKSDPKIIRALKNLDENGGIDLGKIEEQFFPDQGTQVVISEFQRWFNGIGYSFKSENGIKTAFMSWVNQLKHKSIEGDLDKKIVPVVKLTADLEAEFLKFQEMRTKVGFLQDFLCQELWEDRIAYYKSLLKQYGLKSMVRIIATYWARTPGGQGRNKWTHFQAQQSLFKLTEEEYQQICTGQGIEF